MGHGDMGNGEMGNGHVDPHRHGLSHASANSRVYSRSDVIAYWPTLQRIAVR